jgi:ankyrin repeat protein
VEIDAKNDQGLTPLFQSIIMGWLDITKELIDGGANVSEQDIFGRTPLHWAIISFSNDSIQLLLDNPECIIMIPDFCGREPIHEAASTGNDELLKILIHLGCDPACSDNNGLTPLHLACASGNVSCCKMLIDHAVPFNALDFSEDV